MSLLHANDYLLTIYVSVAIWLSSVENTNQWDQVNPDVMPSTDIWWNLFHNIWVMPLLNTCTMLKSDPISYIMDTFAILAWWQRAHPPGVQLAEKQTKLTSTQRSRPELLSAYICRAAWDSDCLCPRASFKTDVAEQHPLQHVLLLFNPSAPRTRCCCCCCICASSTAWTRLSPPLSSLRTVEAPGS